MLNVCSVAPQIYKDFAPFYQLKSPHHIKKTIQQDFQTALDWGRRLITISSKKGEVERLSPGGPFAGDWEDIIRRVS